ncbi:MAG: metallophosphoesterase [Actinomycetota bacterium]
MGFSTAILILAFLHAGAGIWAARPATSLREAVLRSVGGAALTTVGAVIAFEIATEGFDFFAAIHVLYLAACVTVPAIATAGWVARLRGSPGYLAGRRPAVLLTAALVPAMLGVYATHIEPYWLRVDRVELTVTGLDAEIRLGVLADVQTTDIGEYEIEALETLLAESPDVLLVPGDLWQTSDADIEQRWRVWRDYVERMTAAVDHVVIVEGDTDDAGWLRLVVDGTGAHLLVDEVVELDVDGTTVMVGGIPNFTDRLTTGGERVVDRLGAASEDVVTILLSHRPDVAELDATGDAAIDLVVAGHTHGGQIQIPFVGPLVTFSDVPRSVAAGGLHDIGGTTLYVSTGVGLERGHAPQVRFGARPSVGVIDVSGSGPGDG